MRDAHAIYSITETAWFWYTATMETPHVLAVSLSDTHNFSKQNAPQIHLIAGEGVEGDAHCGTTVKHRSRVKQNPDQPNLRQVHLIHSELHNELNKNGFEISPGQMGENITTCCVPLLELPTGTRLQLGSVAIIELTGLRNPCAQLDTFQKGLTAAVIEKDANGTILRKSGVMAIVITGGDVHAGDSIQITLPPEPHRPLMPV
jgi:MOSC domain-containing protein YiiM